MAILVVSLVDHFPEGHEKHGGCQRRGDVIEVFPDDWLFSKNEMGHSDWRIVHAPEMTLEEAQGWTGGAYLHPDSGMIAPFRAFHFDLDHPHMKHVRDSKPGKVTLKGKAPVIENYKVKRTLIKRPFDGGGE